ncbi:programmed cell death 1 ligand 1-like isoform X2 [Leuresthes tenuis]|uniref:programmed cell death 1 ligand 1-like isoform X2 n=1 Tax=Leuresthes tenuis TaxID=355514 RepID=UPI003B507448
MICRILLLIILTSCVCAAFVVNVPQSSYQAEEGQSITLEWTFTAKPDSSWSSLLIFCELRTDDGGSYLYHVHEGDEVSESQEEHFAGRVQSDKDALREGRIRLHVSRLRTEDSGLYLCSVKTDYGSGFGRCRLSVSAAADLSQPQRPTESPQPDTSGGIGLYCLMGLIGGAALALNFLLIYFCHFSLHKTLMQSSQPPQTELERSVENPNKNG